MSYYSNFSKSDKRRLIVVVCILWLIIAILIDHIIFKDSWYARLIALGDVKLSFDPFYRDFSHLSFTTFLFAPFLVTTIVLIVLAIKRRIGKADIIKSVVTLVWWSALIFFIIVGGHMVYRFFSAIDIKIVKAITNFCEGYKVEGQIYMFTLYIATIKSGVGALAGFVLGVYFYYKKGVLKFFIEKLL